MRKHDLFLQRLHAKDNLDKESKVRPNLRPIYRRFSAIDKQLRSMCHKRVPKTELRYWVDQAKRLRKTLYKAQWWGDKDPWGYRGITSNTAWGSMMELDYLIDKAEAYQLVIQYSKFT